jgi:D-alanyl-D-alanine carboxypeptidase-like protein
VLQGRPTDDLDSSLAALHRVGRSQGRLLQTVAQAEQEQSLAASAAADATDAAAADAAAATRAKQTADAAVDAQRQVLARSETALAQAQNAASDAVQRQRALAASASAARFRDNRVTGAVGSCTGGTVSMYPNGQIPIAALCPLMAAPGQYLRADAAHAFDQVTQAYAAHFGGPPCITDSYRTYAQQVTLFAEKPNLAAVPGTSNHGWGTALDLCGGIQNFDTPQHNWLLVNAPLYGWFHPAWAQQGGSRPEPWHWEYGG